MQSITITIKENETEQGYLYSIYLNQDARDIDEDAEEDEGGEYTGEDMQGAINMASEHAKRLLNN